MMINRRLIATVKESKHYIAGNVLCQWLSLLGNIAMMAAMARLFQNLYEGTAEASDYGKTALLVGAVLLLRFACSVFSSRLAYLSSKAVKKTLREQIYSKLLRLGAAYKEQVQTSEVVQVAVEGVDQLETYFGAYLPQFFYAMLAPLTLFAVLFFFGLGFVPLRAVDSGHYRGGTALGKKTAGKILGTVHCLGRHLFGKSARLGDNQNLSFR